MNFVIIDEHCLQHEEWIGVDLDWMQVDEPEGYYSSPGEREQ